MKKTLIALAAIAAVSSAMADVSITGYVDRGYSSINNTNSQVNLATIGSWAGTTGIFFKGNETLNSDLNAVFSVETDYADNGGSTQANALGNNQLAGFANGENYVGLMSKSMGTVKLGDPNSFMLGVVTGIGSPAFGTGYGSAYSSGFSIFNGIGTGATGYGGTATMSVPLTSTTAVTGARDIRLANTIQYTTPSFSGLTASVGYAPQNNVVTNATGNTVGAQEINLTYAAPAFTVAYDSMKYSVGTLGTYQGTLTGAAAGTASAPGTAAAVASLTSNNLYDVKTGTPALVNYTNTHNFFGGTYVLNNSIKLHGGYGSFTSSDNIANGRSTQVGVTYTTGAWELMAQDVQVQDNNSGGIAQLNRSNLAVGANYWFSKTTRAYARYENMNFGSNVTSFVGSSQTRSALGISTSF
jgi:predicted porin